MNVKLRVLSAGHCSFWDSTFKSKRYSPTKIDEVVVVAFGKQKKRLL
jgi:hypothetical protein